MRRCDLLFDDQKGDTYNEAWVKDTNGFDIPDGELAQNIQNIWYFKERWRSRLVRTTVYTLINIQTRSHINFDDGTITIETIAWTEPAPHLCVWQLSKRY
ncbi:murein transglycosylase domain-containing protein [Shigella flexneri]